MKHIHQKCDSRVESESSALHTAPFMQGYQTFCHQAVIAEVVRAEVVRVEVVRVEVVRVEVVRVEVVRVEVVRVEVVRVEVVRVEVVRPEVVNEWSTCTRKFNLQLPRCTSHPFYQCIAILNTVNKVKRQPSPPPHEQRPPI